MHTQQILLTLLAAGQLAAGAVTSGTKSFSVNQKDTGRRKLRNAHVDMADAFAKFGVPVPNEIAEAAAAAVTGSVTATPESFDKAYISPVDVGTPATTLNLDFDTGSSDLWVFSTELPADKRRGHNVYDPSSSTTSKKVRRSTWRITYGDGSSAQGDVYHDKVTIGGVTASKQAVEAAKKISRSFAKTKAQDGLVGLAFKSINEVEPRKQKPFWQSVAPDLKAKSFSANLKAGKPGKYDFGFIDTSAYNGGLVYAPINNKQGFWEFNLDGYKVGSGATQSGTIDVIADTGTSLIYLPANVVSDYYSGVSGVQMSQGAYFFPCANAGQLPNLGLIINGKKRTVPKAYFNYAPAGQGFCFGGLQPSTGLPFGILGDVFLKSQYVVFDFSVPRIGVGQAV